jgi:hypothetical protein
MEILRFQVSDGRREAHFGNSKQTTPYNASEILVMSGNKKPSALRPFNSRISGKRRKHVTELDDTRSSNTVTLSSRDITIIRLEGPEESHAAAIKSRVL